MNLLYIYVLINSYLLYYKENCEFSANFDYLEEKPITFYSLYEIRDEDSDCIYSLKECGDNYYTYSYDLYEYHNNYETDHTFIFNYSSYSINISLYCLYTNNFNWSKIIYFNLFKHTSLSNFEFFFLTKQSNNNLILPSFFYFYQNLFFQKFSKLPVQIKNFNSINFLSKEYLAVIMFQLKKIKWWKYEVKHSTQLVELILIALQFKNLNLIMKWIKSYFERRKLKKHKKLFFFLKYLFLNLIWKFSIKFNIKGIRLYLKGKIGKSGSVRKSKKFGQKGKVSYTTKSLALVSERIVVRTTTGTMGLLLEMFFINDVYFMFIIYIYIYFIITSYILFI